MVGIAGNLRPFYIINTHVSGVHIREPGFLTDVTVPYVISDDWSGYPNNYQTRFGDSYISQLDLNHEILARPSLSLSLANDNESDGRARIS